MLRGHLGGASWPIATDPAVAVGARHQAPIYQSLWRWNERVISVMLNGKSAHFRAIWKTPFENGG
jgi:hypothetical protein